MDRAIINFIWKPFIWSGVTRAMHEAVRAHCHNLCAAKLMLLVTGQHWLWMCLHHCQCMPCTELVWDAMQQLVLVQDGKHKYVSSLLSSELLWLYRSTDALAGTLLYPDMLRSIIRVMKSINQSIYISCLWDSTGESTDNKWANSKNDKLEWDNSFDAVLENHGSGHKQAGLCGKDGWSQLQLRWAGSLSCATLPALLCNLKCNSSAWYQARCH